MMIKAWYPPDYACDAGISADPDIGGLGVLSSFVVVAWITVLVAAVPAMHETIESFQDPQKRYILRNTKGQTEAAKDRQRELRPKSDLDQGRLKRIAEKCTKFLGPLCDLQVITGTAIMVAGWAKIGTISYYHEELVMSYWWLTLNSFWTSRADFLALDSSEDEVRLAVRRVTIVCSCVLGLTFQGYIIHREYETGDDVTGPCYRFTDGSSTIPWMIGVGLFCIAALSMLFKSTRRLNECYFSRILDIGIVLERWYDNSRATEDSGVSTLASMYVPKRKSEKLTFNFLLASACRALWFIVVLWLSVWSYGNSFMPAQWLFYFLFNVWNTYDTISIWRMNQVLITNEKESQMRSFGQVLPLVLIASILFSAIDIFREKPDLSKTQEYEQHVARYNNTEQYLRESQDQNA